MGRGHASETANMAEMVQELGVTGEPLSRFSCRDEDVAVVVVDLPPLVQSSLQLDVRRAAADTTDHVVVFKRIVGVVVPDMKQAIIDAGAHTCIVL